MLIIKKNLISHVHIPTLPTFYLFSSLGCDIICKEMCGQIAREVEASAADYLKLTKMFSGSTKFLWFIQNSYVISFKFGKSYFYYEIII